MENTVYLSQHKALVMILQVNHKYNFGYHEGGLSRHLQHMALLILS